MADLVAIVIAVVTFCLILRLVLWVDDRLEDR